MDMQTRRSSKRFKKPNKRYLNDITERDASTGKSVNNSVHAQVNQNSKIFKQINS